MGEYVSVLLLGGAFVAAVAVLLTADPKISKGLTAAAGAIALIGGLALYGYGYLAVAMSPLEAMLRTVFAACRMFIGEADFGDISEAPLFVHKWAVTACWCVHVLAFYATSSAAIFSATNSTDFPCAKAFAISTVIVWDFPVPGGP